MTTVLLADRLAVRLTSGQRSPLNVVLHLFVLLHVCVCCGAFACLGVHVCMHACIHV